MRITRIYQKQPLIPQSEITLDEWGSHHLLDVLRLKVGDKIILFNGEGSEYLGEIHQILKKKIIIKIAHQTHSLSPHRESRLNLHLGQVLIKNEAMDMIIQKATELGVTSITPLFGTRSVIQIKDKRESRKLEHWQKISIRAAEQCGRTVLPVIHSPKLLTEWLPNTPETHKLIAHPASDTQETQEIAHGIHPSSIALLIGPEGGFSDYEIELATRNGFIPINLGPRILRAETAAIAAITLLQARYGDLALIPA